MSDEDKRRYFKLTLDRLLEKHDTPRMDDLEAEMDEVWCRLTDAEQLSIRKALGVYNETGDASGLRS